MHVVLVAPVKLSFEGLAEVDVVLGGRTARALDVGAHRGGRSVVPDLTGTAAGFAPRPLAEGLLGGSRR